ncbi:MAG: 5-formyltetrahydrofolate cyclo-ligase [Magnetococcales bacterium]|nr:5-formyltetrahydrofolate cyclo-ligase [Magnetococcales bacterium]NGZ27315.1 5-formyltetrahydrofolate cyclo-ligase [Magnetococcales bacterium]
MQDDPVDKKFLRRKLRAERQALSDAWVQQWSQAISQRLQSMWVVASASRVAAYMAMDREVDVVTGEGGAWLADKKLYLPKVMERQMVFVPYQRGEPLQQGAYGILEPQIGDKKCLSGLDIGHLDLLVVPLVGFDGTGTRLGYGGGYFDRLLAPWNPSLAGEMVETNAARPLLIGVAYSFQEVAFLPREKHDFCLDYVVTEKGIHHFSGPSSGNQRFPVQ